MDSTNATAPENNNRKSEPAPHLIEDEETEMPPQKHIKLPLNYLHTTLLDDDDSYKHKMKTQSKNNFPSTGIQLEPKHALNQLHQRKFILLVYLMKS